QSGHVYGVDITQEMIEKAKENVKQKNVTFLHTSFNSIPLPENSIDCVLSNCAVNHSVDKLSVLKEVKRILKSGGRFILSDIFAVKKIPPEISMDKEAIAACYGGAVLLSEMAQMAEEAGFFVFDIREKGDPYLKENVELFSATIKIM
ncbi:MAG: methyltransferase domain-containing protein, partial [Candidatus Hydrogenedentota bacterium]